MFCELVHTVQRDESVWNLPVRLLALPLLSVMIRRGERWAVGCGLGGSG